MSEPTPDKATHVPEKMRGPNRGDLQTKLVVHDQSKLDASWIKTQTGAGEVKDKK